MTRESLSSCSDGRLSPFDYQELKFLAISYPSVSLILECSGMQWNESYTICTTLQLINSVIANLPHYICIKEAVCVAWSIFKRFHHKNELLLIHCTINKGVVKWALWCFTFTAYIVLRFIYHPHRKTTLRWKVFPGLIGLFPTGELLFSKVPPRVSISYQAGYRQHRHPQTRV